MPMTVMPNRDTQSQNDTQRHPSGAIEPQRDSLFAAPIAKLGDWTFDEKVAEVFPDMNMEFGNNTVSITAENNLAFSSVINYTGRYDGV